MLRSHPRSDVQHVDGYLESLAALGACAVTCTSCAGCRPTVRVRRTLDFFGEPELALPEERLRPCAGARRRREVEEDLEGMS